MHTDQLAATRRLLVDELDGPRFSDPRYLEWFYESNPRGAALQENVDDDEGRRVGHYGVLPARFRHRTAVSPFIFSSNVATDSSTRRGGLFRQMAERMYERAAATGAPAMVGVGNDASTVVVVERFGWRTIAPMRARASWSVRTRGTRRYPITEAFLQSADFERITAFLEDVDVTNWAQHWDTEFLRWRLARPDGGYVLHDGPDGVAVTVGTTGPLGVPFSVLLKVWPKPHANATAARKLSAAAFVASALRAHRGVACVYAGWNERVRIPGFAIPHRLQPSPLNVVIKVLDSESFDAEAFTLDAFELLDMDAY